MMIIMIIMMIIIIVVVIIIIIIIIIIWKQSTKLGSSPKMLLFVLAGKNENSKTNKKCPIYFVQPIKHIHKLTPNRKMGKVSVGYLPGVQIWRSFFQLTPNDGI